MEKSSGRLTDEEAEVLLCDGSDPHGAGLGVVGAEFQCQVLHCGGGWRNEARA